MNINILLIFLLISYPWPMRNSSGNFHGPRSVSSVMGDYRRNSTNTGTPRFHRGFDMPADSGTPVYSIISDDGNNVHASPLNHYVRIGDYLYDHVNPCIDSGTPVVGINEDPTNPDTIATIRHIGPDHLHFQIGSSGGPYYNPITYGDSLENYTDNTSPVIDTLEVIHYFVEGAETTSTRIELDSIIHNKIWLYGKVDIRVKVRDPDVDPVGTIPAGIYKAYYGIKTMVGDTIKDSLTTIEFDQVEPPTNGLQTCLIYDTLLSRHAQSSTFRYWLTNPINAQHNVNDGYWNTKQKLGEPDSIDADSIEEAKYPDGEYKVIIKAFDIKGNEDTLIDTVHIDNFMPRVKKSFPFKDTTYSVIAAKSTKLYLQFSEEMDTAMLKISNIHINSLKDSHIYDIDSLSYYKDSSYLFIYMDTTFRLQDTVRLKLDMTITDLSGKPIKDSTGEYEIDFVVGLKQITDNDTDDAVASIYGDKIVWVYGNYNDDHSTFTGDIMEYDIKTGQTQMISNGTDHLFTRPYIYKDKVAYFYAGYYWTNAVLYYDEAGNTSIISHSSETRAGYSLQVGDSGIVWRGAYPGAGSTDTTFVFFYRYSDMTTHLLSQEVSEVYGIYAGTMSIDGDKITYNQPSPDSSWNIYIYNIGLMSELQLTHYHQYPEIYYYNPIISNGQISFEGEGGIGDSVRGIYTYDGSDILTVESKNDIYYSTNSPSLHRGHIVYPLLHSTSTKHTKFMNSIPFPKTSKNRLKERNAHYINRLKSNQFIIKQIKNREVNNQIQNSISLRNAISVNYLRYFDGRHNITIDQDTTSDFPYLCYKDWGTLYGYIYFIAEHPLTKGNEVCLISKSNEDLIKTNIWHDYSDSSHTPETGYRPIYKGNFVFSAYDGNDYELYLYMGDTTNCVPAVPEGLHYTTSTKSNDVQLYWNKAEDATLYRIYKSTDSHEYGSYLATTSDTFYIDTAITGNTMYYTISSMNGDNESGLSKQITVNEFDTIGPTAPESLRITNIDTVEMKLSLNWKKSISSDVEKYLIYKKTGIYGEFNIYDSTDKSITEYNDTNIQFGINYFYKTSAMDYRGNEGAYSNEVDTTIIHSSGICFRKSREFTIRYSTIQSNGIFLFKLINGKGKEIDTRIYDLGGRIIYRKIITPGNANVMEKANVKKNGIYFIEFRYDKKRYVKKIVIL